MERGTRLLLCASFEFDMQQRNAQEGGLAFLKGVSTVVFARLTYIRGGYLGGICHWQMHVHVARRSVCFWYCPDCRPHLGDDSRHMHSINIDHIIECLLLLVPVYLLYVLDLYMYLITHNNYYNINKNVHVHVRTNLKNTCTSACAGRSNIFLHMYTN